MDKYELNTKESAKLTGLVQSTIQEYARKRKLKGGKKNGRWVFFRPSIETLAKTLKSHNNLMEPEEVGDYLKADGSQVRRWHEYGFLDGIEVQGKLRFNPSAVQDFNTRVKAREKIDVVVKQAYSNWICGVSGEELSSHLEIDEKTLLSGVDQYMRERERKLFVLGIPKEYVMQHFILMYLTEAAARFDIADWRVIKDLIADNKLESISFNTSQGEKEFVYKSSLVNFLGDYSKEILYKSTQVAEELEKSRLWVDRRSKYHDIGMKLKQSNQGIRFYDKEDIERLRAIKMKRVKKKK